MTRTKPDVRWRTGATLALLALLLSGCSFLANEFGWLDRAAPQPAATPLLERP